MSSERDFKDLIGEEKNKFLSIYRSKRALFKREIIKAKRNHWKTFCDSAREPYGSQFKLVFTKGNHPTTQIPIKLPDAKDNTAQIAEKILATLFPETTHTFPPFPSTNKVDPPFNLEEINKALMSTNSKKAHGFDGIDYALLKDIKNFSRVTPQSFQ